jgi:hypothetical protein
MLKLSAFLTVLTLTTLIGKTNYILDSNDLIGIKYDFDTTQYKIHKSGFYLSKKNDIFQLNTLTYEDSTDYWTTHYWLDSLMFYGEYPNKKPLREIIDLTTFTTDTLSNFEKDKHYVYFVRATSDGVCRYIVPNADTKSFQGIIDRWGKDNTYIFYETKIVKKADLKSFHVLTDVDSAQDKKYIYYRGERIR